VCKELEKYFDLLRKIQKDVENNEIDITDKSKVIELLYEINLIERNLIDIQEQTSDLTKIIHTLYDKLFSNFDGKELFQSML